MVAINIDSPYYKLIHLHKYPSITSLIFICLFISNPVVYSDNILQRWDQDLFNRIYDAPPHSEPLWTGMEITTEFGHYRAVMGCSILLMAYGNEDHRNTGRLVTSAYLGACVVTYGMKHLIGRKRPLDTTLGSPAMPSGHAALAFSTATDSWVSISEVAYTLIYWCWTGRILTHLSWKTLYIRRVNRCWHRHNNRFPRLEQPQ